MKRSRIHLATALLVQTVVISMLALHGFHAVDKKLHAKLVDVFIEQTRHEVSRYAGNSSEVDVSLIQRTIDEVEIIVVSEAQPVIGARTLVVDDQIVSTRISYVGRIALPQ